MARHGNLRPLRLAGLALGAALAAATPAAAQSAEPQPAVPEDGSAAPAACQVFAQPIENEQVEEVQAICGGRLLILGRATAHAVTPNKDLGATLIDIRLRDERRVWMLSLGPDGLPLSEDISGQIALAAGRGPMSEIGDLTVDFEAFARTGDIAVQADARAETAGGAARLSLDEQLAPKAAR